MEACKIDYKRLGLSFHSFSHFFNTKLVASGVDGELARGVIGHASVEIPAGILASFSGGYEERC